MIFFCVILSLLFQVFEKGFHISCSSFLKVKYAKFLGLFLRLSFQSPDQLCCSCLHLFQLVVDFPTISSQNWIKYSVLVLIHIDCSWIFISIHLQITLMQAKFDFTFVAAMMASFLPFLCFRLGLFLSHLLFLCFVFL